MKIITLITPGSVEWRHFYAALKLVMNNALFKNKCVTILQGGAKFDPVEFTNETGIDYNLGVE